MINRLVIFGYEIVNGIITVNTREATIVKDIFYEYILGKSLKSIADKLTKNRIEIFNGKTTWDKCRVSRIISNKKYIGEDDYPQIIEFEIFEKANSLKKTKQTPQSKINQESEKLNVKVYCKECGRACIRKHKAGGKARLRCPNGCRCHRYLTDDSLYTSILDVVDKITISDNEVAKIKEPLYCRTQEIMRYSNEISRMINGANPSFLVVKQAILNYAGLKFRVCKEDKEKIYSDMVNVAIKEVAETRIITDSFLQNIIDKIYVDELGKIVIDFINGTTETNRSKEDTNASTKVSNKN